MDEAKLTGFFLFLSLRILAELSRFLEDLSAFLPGCCLGRSFFNPVWEFLTIYIRS